MKKKEKRSYLKIRTARLVIWKKRHCCIFICRERNVDMHREK